VTYYPVEGTPEERAAYSEIMDNMPKLMYLKHQLALEAIRPSGVVLPARLKPKEEGVSTLMCLPVTWSEKEEWGLFLGITPTKKEAGE